MNYTEKFYSDIKKLTYKFSGEELYQNLGTAFIHSVNMSNKRAVPIAKDIFEDWLNTYRISFPPFEESSEYFYKILCFLTDCFDESMDFSGSEWKSLELIISSAADELDMDLLNSLMTVLVDRKKI